MLDLAGCAPGDGAELPEGQVEGAIHVTAQPRCNNELVSH